MKKEQGVVATGSKPPENTQAAASEPGLRAEEASPPSFRPTPKPPQKARCARCGAAELAALPTFSTGSGIAYKTVADDIYCLRCGYIGEYAI